MSDISALPLIPTNTDVPLSERSSVAPKLLEPEKAFPVEPAGQLPSQGNQANVPEAAQLIGLTLYRDAASGLHVAVYTDKATGEVQRQIPEEKVLRHAARERQLVENTFDRKLTLKA